SAQPFPSKQVRLVTPFPPGGSADVIARIAGQRLGEIFGQPVLVENRPGAGGVVGSDYVAKQPHDGHTLLLVTGAYPVSAVMMKALPFDPLNDIAMVSLLTSYPFVISVAPGSPFKSLGELIAYAKAHPGKLNYPSGGIAPSPAAPRPSEGARCRNRRALGRAGWRAARQLARGDAPPHADGDRQMAQGRRRAQHRAPVS